MELIHSYHTMEKAEKILLLSKLRKDCLNSKSIFSDETRNFRQPVEPTNQETITVKIRVSKNNTDKILLCYNGASFELKLSYSEGLFDYYCGSIPPQKENFRYFFEIHKDDNIYYYNKKGLVKHIDPHYNFSVIYNFATPDWAKGAIMYQIYPDRFFNGDPSNDVKTNEYVYLGKPAQKIENWYQLPAEDDIRNFYGGDIKGIMDKMDYLKDLGIEAIYLNPVFVSPSNHKYDIQDYDYVDPHLGAIPYDSGDVLVFEKFRNKFATLYMNRTTDKRNLEASNELMCRFIECAHQHGIKIILDGVFNHCGAFNKWLDREGFYQANENYPPGAYREKNSPYNRYFKWYDDNNWPNNDAYDAWWGHDNHPKLNFENSPELCQYILEIGKKWVSPPYNADGWRLDVAADLGSSEAFNHHFWQDFRDAVKSANPDAIILAEHYGNATSWLQGDQWDTIMNYDAFMEPITWFLTGMEKHSEDFKNDMLNNAWVFESAMRYHMASLNIQNIQISMNQLSNHDHSRFLTRTNMTVGRLHTKGSEAAGVGISNGIMKEAVTFLMTWPGAPTIYYGDEVGLCGWTDPDNRRTYPWGRENKDFLNFHKELIKLRKNYPALKTGSLDFIFIDYGVLCYGRWDNDDKFVVILNNDAHERSVVVPVWKIGIGLWSTLRQLIISDEAGFYKTNTHFPVKKGQLSLLLPPRSSMIFQELTTS